MLKLLRINGIKIYYDTGFIQEWGSFGDHYSLLDNLLDDPIVAVSYSAQKQGQSAGDFVGFMRGFQIKTRNGRVSTFGDYAGRRNQVFVLHDDYSFPGANGQVWLCGLTTHGSATWSIRRIHGMAPHWCYQETVIAEGE